MFASDSSVPAIVLSNSFPQTSQNIRNDPTNIENSQNLREASETPEHFQRHPNASCANRSELVRTSLNWVQTSPKRPKNLRKLQKLREKIAKTSQTISRGDRYSGPRLRFCLEVLASFKKFFAGLGTCLHLLGCVRIHLFPSKRT